MLHDDWFARRSAHAQNEYDSNVFDVIMWDPSLQDADRARSQTCILENPQNKSDVENAEKHPIGFRRLVEISKKEPVSIVLELSNSNPFFLHLEQEMTEPDLIILIVKIISVITDCTFAKTKAQLLTRICNTRFLKTLADYIAKLPNMRFNDKMRNRLFWCDIDSFWLNFNKFCYCLLTVSPTVACENLPALLDIAKFCIARLEKKQSEILREDIVSDLKELEVKLQICIEERDKKEVTKNWNGCTHEEVVTCHENIDDVPCKKLCKRVIPKCSHNCKKKCSETCGGCTIEIDKVLPCGHTGKIICGRDGDARYPLPNCIEPMPHNFISPCGHRFLIPCYRAKFPERPSDEVLLSYCKVKCVVKLACGHNCAGDCSACYQKRVHVLCAAKCGKTLVCGHLCEVPCNEACPPCNKNCVMRCIHSKCANKCGEECTPCVEKCEWKCPHLTCTEFCGKLCSRKNCKEKCPLELNCGHNCRGVCGELCPTACKECDPENFPRDLLGGHYADDVILVQLQDCGHMMNVDKLDAFMNTGNEKGEKFLKCCPFCKTPILNTRRCLDVVKKVMKENIQQAKERIYGNKEKNTNDREYLLSKINGIVKQFPVLIQDCPNFHKIILRIHKLLKPEDNNDLQILSLKVLEAFKFNIKILELLENDAKDLQTLITDKALILNQIDAVIGYLIRFLGKLSSQLHSDIQLEMQRLASIIQYVKLLQSEQYKDGNMKLDVLQADNAVKAVIFAYARFDYYRMDDAKNCMNTFQKSLKTVITKAERNMVFKAVNFSRGHWYRCPNGHLYVIENCGRPMQISRCFECGAQVGGDGHYLLHDNTPAADAFF